MIENDPLQTSNHPIKLEEDIKINPDINLKKELTLSLNILVIKRILNILHQNGRINRTNLAGKTGLNYTTCTRYVNTLELLGWIRILSDYNLYVVITERGIEIKVALETLHKMYD